MFAFRQTAGCVARLLTRNALKSATISESRSIKRWVAPTLKELRRRQKQAGEQPPQPRSSYLEWNYDAELYAFGKRLGETFDEQLLRRALTHRSFNLKNDDAENTNDNRELITGGDLLIHGYIKDVFGKRYSADITAAVDSYLTSDEMLAHVAKHMGLSDLILSADFPVETRTLADTFKAVVAALKASADESRAQLFVRDFLLVQLNGKEVYDIWTPENPYKYLLDLLKTRGVANVEPRLCNESASNTILANYQVGIYNAEDKKLLGIGWGESVSIAKETAALDAIQRIYRCNDLSYK